MQENEKTAMLEKASALALSLRPCATKLRAEPKLAFSLRCMPDASISHRQRDGGRRQKVRGKYQRWRRFLRRPHARLPDGKI